MSTVPRGLGLASALVMGLGWAPGGLGVSITGLVADRFSLFVGLQMLVVPPLLGIILHRASCRPAGAPTHLSGWSQS